MIHGAMIGRCLMRHFHDLTATKRHRHRRHGSQGQPEGGEQKR